MRMRPKVNPAEYADRKNADDGWFMRELANPNPTSRIPRRWLMKTEKLGIVLLGALAMLTNAAAGAEPTTDQKAVAALDSEYQLAVKNNDADTMNRILADDFVLVWGNGETHNKTDLLNDARTKRVQYEHNEDTDKTVRVWGNTAVITSKLWVKGVDKGKPFEWHVWFNDTYVRTPSGWRYVDGFASLPLEMLPSHRPPAQ
jgi:ketosteroid isomerase-like protein